MLVEWVTSIINSVKPKLRKPMSVRAVLSRLLSSDGTEVVVECRQCGANLSPDAEECPECGSDEIVRHRIPK